MKSLPLLAFPVALALSSVGFAQNAAPAPGGDAGAAPSPVVSNPNPGSPPTVELSAPAPAVPPAVTSVTPDGRMVTPDGRTITADGRVITPDGRVVNPDGTTVAPDGTIRTPAGTTVLSNGTVVTPQGVTVPSGVQPSANTVAPLPPVPAPNASVPLVGRPGTVSVLAPIDATAFNTPTEVSANISGKTPATAALDTVSTVQAIRTTMQSRSEPVLDAVASKLDAAAKAATGLSLAKPDAAAQTELAAAIENVKSRETIVRARLEEARSAGIHSWGDAQLALGNDYTEYAQAVARAETIALSGLPVPPEPMTPPTSALPATGASVTIR